MSSNTIKGTAERDGSITINGSTGSKEYKFSIEYQRERTDLVSNLQTLNVTADSPEDAIQWTRMNQSEIDMILWEEGELHTHKFDQGDYSDHELGEPFAGSHTCDGEVMRQNGESSD